MKKELEAIAQDVINRLDGKMIIHRYNSYSTNSIYLKFDYGVACSLRISDHDGYKHLRYRFNILESMADCSSKKESYRNGFQMIFYAPNMVNACCEDILREKQSKMEKYHSYQAVVLKAKQEATSDKGFWHGAKLVNKSY